MWVGNHTFMLAEQSWWLPNGLEWTSPKSAAKEASEKSSQGNMWDTSICWTVDSGRHWPSCWEIRQGCTEKRTSPKWHTAIRRQMSVLSRFSRIFLQDFSRICLSAGWPLQSIFCLEFKSSLEGLLRFLWLLPFLSTKFYIFPQKFSGRNHWIWPFCTSSLMSDLKINIQLQAAVEFMTVFFGGDNAGSYQLFKIRLGNECRSVVFTCILTSFKP